MLHSSFCTKLCLSCKMCILEAHCAQCHMIMCVFSTLLHFILCFCFCYYLYHIFTVLCIPSKLCILEAQCSVSYDHQMCVCNYLSCYYAIIRHLALRADNLDIVKLVLNDQQCSSQKMKIFIFFLTWVKAREKTFKQQSLYFLLAWNFSLELCQDCKFSFVLLLKKTFM